MKLATPTPRQAPKLKEFENKIAARMLGLLTLLILGLL
jgi:hypothetical protein